VGKWGIQNEVDELDEPQIKETKEQRQQQSRSSSKVTNKFNKILRCVSHEGEAKPGPINAIKITNKWKSPSLNPSPPEQNFEQRNIKKLLIERSGDKDHGASSRGRGQWPSKLQWRVRRAADVAQADTTPSRINSARQYR